MTSGLALLHLRLVRPDRLCALPVAIFRRGQALPTDEVSFKLEEPKHVNVFRTGTRPDTALHTPAGRELRECVGVHCSSEPFVRPCHGLSWLPVAAVRLLGAIRGTGASPGSNPSEGSLPPALRAQSVDRGRRGMSHLVLLGIVSDGLWAYA